MFDYLAAQIAELKEDETTRALTLASCASNLESLLSMIRHGIAADRAEAPVASLAHARHMAARGASIDATLRFYRLGHAWFASAGTPSWRTGSPVARSSSAPYASRLRSASPTSTSSRPR